MKTKTIGIIIISVILTIIVVGGGMYYYQNQLKKQISILEVEKVNLEKQISDLTALGTTMPTIPGETSSWIEYTDKKGGYRVQYPHGWIPGETNNKVFFGFDGTYVAVEYFDRSQKSIEQVIADLGVPIPGFEGERHEIKQDVFVGTIRAIKVMVVYTFKNRSSGLPDASVTATAVVFEHGNRIFVLNHEYAEEQFFTFYKSFRFLP